MGHHKLFYLDPKEIRNQLNEATDLAMRIHDTERALIQMLYAIDNQNLYVRYGFNSLSGFCRFGLKFSKTQTQRIVTLVRRLEVMDKLPD